MTFNICFFEIHLNCRCRCTNCGIMREVVECVCCREVPCIVSKMAETDNPNACITTHPSFAPVVLYKDVLDVAYIGYKTKDQRRLQQESINK